MPTGILLLRRDAGKGLEPVKEMGDAQSLGPLHHGISDDVGSIPVQLDVRVLPGLDHLGVAGNEGGREGDYANLGTLFCNMSSLKEYMPKTSSMRTFEVERARREFTRCLV